MFTKFLVAASVCTLLFIGCAPKIRTNIAQKYPPLHFKEELWTIPEETDAPARAEHFSKHK